MPSLKLKQEALDDAFRLHFSKLFEVLMSEQSERAVERFNAGLRRTMYEYDRINEMIMMAEL